MDLRSPEEWRPAFRELNVRRAVAGDDPGLALTDPLGLLDGAVFVPDGLLPVVGRIDGARSVADIEAELRAEGHDVPDGVVLRICRDLEESLLFQGELFETTLDRTIDDYLAAPVRAARHCGAPDACRTLVEAALGGADVDPPGNVGAADRRPAPRALIAPHIDLGRGGRGYGAAYRELRDREAAELFVVLGTGHAGPDQALVGLAQDWETPCGTLRTDRGFVAAVHDAVGAPSRADRFLHRGEHSIEFQMLFLARLFADRPAVRVAGFLCGALTHHDGDPGSTRYVRRILAALRAAAGAHGGRVCFVGGADLAHVGPEFGDREPVDAARRERLERDDRHRLEPLLDANAGAFHRRVLSGGNPDQLCSASAMYLVAALADAPGRLLDYGQSVDAAGQGCVSWCAAVFD
ncbi:MAG: AmmeMemoRadiSam system protein B [Planctomycetes bacterium]|nr:AmmeMemoRadiSam system protein B [Planctomycetota bacterium]